MRLLLFTEQGPRSRQQDASAAGGQRFAEMTANPEKFLRPPFCRNKGRGGAERQVARAVVRYRKGAGGIAFRRGRAGLVAGAIFQNGGHAAEVQQQHAQRRAYAVRHKIDAIGQIAAKCGLGQQAAHAGCHIPHAFAAAGAGHAGHEPCQPRRHETAGKFLAPAGGVIVELVQQQAGCHIPIQRRQVPKGGQAGSKRVGIGQVLGAEQPGSRPVQGCSRQCGQLRPFRFLPGLRQGCAGVAHGPGGRSLPEQAQLLCKKARRAQLGKGEKTERRFRLQRMGMDGIDGVGRRSMRKPLPYRAAGLIKVMPRDRQIGVRPCRLRMLSRHMPSSRAQVCPSPVSSACGVRGGIPQAVAPSSASAWHKSCR